MSPKGSDTISNFIDTVIMRDASPVGVVLAVLLLAGCANSPAPQNIAANYVSSIPYQSWTCSQLHQEQSSLDAALASVSTKQEQVRSDERVRSVVSMLIPLPPDMGTANVASQMEIAHLKGEQDAVRQALASNSCPPANSRQTSADNVAVAHERED